MNEEWLEWTTDHFSGELLVLKWSEFAEIGQFPQKT